MKRICFSLSVLSAYSAFAVFEYAVFESVTLDGEWEMAYSPYEHRTVVCLEFNGVRVPKAIPGYWEDMWDNGRFVAFRAGEFALP